MAKKKKTKAPSKREQRRMRTTQIIFAIIAGMIILSMLISFIRF
jgi:predicted nucleic acid-binding Zn ribbon protein